MIANISDGERDGVKSEKVFDTGKSKYKKQKGVIYWHNGADYADNYDSYGGIQHER